MNQQPLTAETELVNSVLQQESAISPSAEQFVNALTNAGVHPLAIARVQLRSAMHVLAALAVMSNQSDEFFESSLRALVDEMIEVEKAVFPEVIRSYSEHTKEAA